MTKVFQRIHLFMPVFCLGLSAKAQNQRDTLKTLRFSGIQVEVQGPITFNSASMTKQDVLALNTGDPLIQQSFDGYTKSLFYYGTTNMNFNGSFAARCFFTVNRKPFHYVDAYAGIAFGLVETGTLGYYKESLDTSDIFSSNSGSNVFEVRKNVMYHHFSVQAQRANVLFGLNTGTKKHRRFWFTAGLEFSPGLLFGYTYRSSSLFTEEKFLIPENNTDPLYTYPPRQSAGGTTSEMQKSLRGTGFYMHMALPLTMNVRLSKKIKVLKNLHLSMQIAPGYMVSAGKISGNHSQFAFFTNVGIRYMR